MRGLKVAIVGAGAVGLSVAYHLVQAGAQVLLVDRDPAGDKASFGNAGAIAVTEVVPAATRGIALRALAWMLDPLGPLAVRPRHAPKLLPWLNAFVKASRPQQFERISRALAAINSRVYEDLIPLLRATGLVGELHRKGALTVYETDAGYRRDLPEWACKRAHGIELQDMTGAEARELEPALGSCVQRAVFTPQWSHVSDPRFLLYRLSEWLLGNSATVSRGEVLDIVQEPGGSIALELVGGGRLSADRAVIAAGAWSALLAGRLGDRILLESERGYNSTLPHPGIVLDRTLIFAERKFVATPLSCGLRIGGAAEFGGLSAPPNFKRSQALLELARRYLPGLRSEEQVSWAGHRPTTPDSLPVLGPSTRHRNIFYAFGHGHLGLTQAATTGRLICELVLGRPPLLDLSPYNAQRFQNSGRV